jgi:hypothetical protein
MVEHPSLPRTMMSRTRPLGRRAAGRGRGGRREWRGCGEAAARLRRELEAGRQVLLHFLALRRAHTVQQ